MPITCRLIPVLVLALALGSCTHKAPQAPAMQAVTPPPPQKNWAEKTGDATWNAVASPLRGLTPAPKPKPAPRLQPLDPPELTIVTRANRGVVSDEPAPSPATAPGAQP